MRYKGRCPSCSVDFYCDEEEIFPRYQYGSAMAGSCTECGKTCIVEESEDADFIPRFRCPQCFEHDLQVVMRRWAELIQEPNDIQTNVVESDEDEWDEGSLMKCQGCQHFAMTKRFDRSRVPQDFLVVGQDLKEICQCTT